MVLSRREERSAGAQVGEELLREGQLRKRLKAAFGCGFRRGAGAGSALR